MKRLISIHWNTLRGVVDLINSDIHTRITLFMQSPFIDNNSIRVTVPEMTE